MSHVWTSLQFGQMSLLMSLQYSLLQLTLPCIFAQHFKAWAHLGSPNIFRDSFGVASVFWQ